MSFKRHQHCCMRAQGCGIWEQRAFCGGTVTCQALCIGCLFQPKVGAVTTLPLRGKKRREQSFWQPAQVTYPE